MKDTPIIQEIPKVLETLCQELGMEISYCITISFPHEKHYYLLLQDLNQLKKSRPTGLTPSSVCSAPAVLAHFPLLSP